MTPSALSIVKVVAFHEKNTADVLDLKTGAKMPRVTIMCGRPVSTNSGSIATPEPTKGDDEYSPFETKDRDIYAGLGYFGNVPVIMGFFYPQVCQMFFADLARTFSRHASDVYSTTDKDGNVEVYHPSGTFMRIAVDPEHEDLTGKDIDGKWKIAKNTDKAVHVRLVVANGGETKADVHILPSGHVNITTPQVTVKGNVTIEGDGGVTGGWTVGAGASGTFTTPTGLTVTVQDGIVTNIF